MGRARTWDNLNLPHDATAHPGALDLVYIGMVANHRNQIEKLQTLDHS